MKDPPDITIVGGARVDNVLCHTGEAKELVEGGNAFFAAAAARIWGSRRMTVVTRIRPPWAPSWTAAVRAAGIEVLARDTPGPRASIENFFAYDESGFRTTIPAREWFSRAGLPLPPVDVAVFKEEVSELDYEAEHVLLTPSASEVPAETWASSALLLMTAPYVNQREWIDAVRITAAARRDRLVLLDAYPTYMRDVDDDALRYLLSGATVFLPSEAELRARFSGKSIEDALRQLLDLGPAAIALKRGPEGCVLATSEGFFTVPSISVATKDPTGAGDSFAGGFAVGWLETRDPLVACMYGTVSASFMVEEFGFLHMFSIRRKDADARLERLRASVDRPLGGERLWPTMN